MVVAGSSQVVLPLCVNCDHWIPFSPQAGQCRRYPPQVNIWVNENGPNWSTDRPCVGVEDSCGEWRASEEKSHDG